MDSFEINKILGALLGTCLILLAVHLASGAIFASPEPAKPGYVVQVKAEQPAAPSGGAQAPAGQPIETLLATASPQQGAEVAKQCEICHNLGKGQGAKIGPDLYGVVGRPIASEAGFNYSAALKAKAKGGKWTFDALNVWLTDPQADVPGTLMTFAGLSSERQRAEVIAYLNSNSDHPLPLPKAAQNPPKPPAGAKPSASAAGTSPAAATPPTPPAGAKPSASAAGTSPAAGTAPNATKAPASPPAAPAAPATTPAPAAPPPAAAPSAPAK